MNKKKQIISFLLLVTFTLNFILPTTKVEAAEDYQIIGQPTATVEQMKEWAKSKNATNTFVQLADIYMALYQKHGNVNPVIAYAQSAKETGYGKFGGVIDETYRNPCGLKTATGGGDTDPNAHQRFNSWEDGISAHLDHLALYAGADTYPRAANETLDQRHFPYLLGKAPKVTELGGNWAPSPTYGQEICTLVDEINNTKVPTKTSMMHIDTKDVIYDENVVVSGWALSDLGLNTVKVYLDDNYVGDAKTGIETPEVDKAYPGYLNGKNSGYSYTINKENIAYGKHTLKVEGINNDGSTFNKSKEITFQMAQAKLPARAFIDTPRTPQAEDVKVSGWALNQSGVKKVEIYIDDKYMGDAKLGLSRPDVDKAYPGYPNGVNSGYEYVIGKDLISSGGHKVSAKAIGNDGTSVYAEDSYFDMNKAEKISLSYQSHVQNIGWQGYVSEGELSGTTGQRLRVEAIKLDAKGLPQNASIECQAHVQNEGWLSWVKQGQVAGTTGKGQRLEAIKIRANGLPAGYSVSYQVHVQNIGWMPWVNDGEIAGTTGQGLRIEAIRIKLVNKANEPKLSYRAHLQQTGWSDYVAQNTVLGNGGSGLRMEALQLKLEGNSSLKVKYQTHVQNIGWTPWSESGQISGTEGQGLRVEGIRVKLENNPDGYHILYRTYVEGMGWQNWVADGDISGIVGQRRKVEAIQIKLVKNIDEQLKPKIAIDIGHNSQFDTGATGIEFEDKLTKEVGEVVINKLKNLGYNVICVTPESATSTNDSLLQRSSVANQNEVNKIVSIHFNKFNGSANGTEVYYFRPTSEIDATNVLNELVGLGFYNRGIKDGSWLSVLKHTEAPGILVECCFLDSSKDMSIYEKTKVGNAIVKGIIKQ